MLGCMKRSRLPLLPFSVQLTLDHPKCTSSNVTEHRNIPGVTPGFRTLSAWGYGRSSYHIPHLYTPLPLTKRDATMAVPQADKLRGPTYEQAWSRVALAESRIRSQVHVLSGYGWSPWKTHESARSTSTKSRTPPFLGSLTRTLSPPSRPSDPTPPFSFLRHVLPPCIMCPLACPTLKPKPHAAVHSQCNISPESSLCSYPIQRERWVSRAYVRRTRRSVLPRVAPQGGRAGRAANQQRARLAQRTDGLAALRIRHAPRRARKQPTPALDP